MVKKIKKEVCEEAPVDLFVNGKKLVTFMCTPNHLNELAAGYLFCKGLIADLDDIMLLAACDDMRMINVRTRGLLTEEQYGLGGILASGCGSDVLLPDKLAGLKNNSSEFQISLDRIRLLTKEMFAQATLYQETGGMHSACLAGDEGLVVCREDVGRHNAVDKAVGKGLFLGLDLSRHIIITTGRLSSDMVLKAAVAGIPLVASRGIPSSLALEISERVGLTIVGRAARSRPLVYTYPHRLTNS